MARASIFVSSSTENRELADTIQVLLHDVADVTVWNQGVFELGQTVMESLEKAAEKFDFAILLLAHDDLIRSRDVEYKSVRDNILIETGLFVGRLGRSRTFLICAKDESLKIPSDLAGLNVATFLPPRSADEVMAALGPACTQIRWAVKSLGPRPRLNADKSQLTVGLQLLRGPHQILEAIVDALDSVELANAVVYRVLPMELTHGIPDGKRPMVERYEELMKKLIVRGTSDIGFWDKTIYGRALNLGLNEKTTGFIKSMYVPCPDTSYIGVDEDYNHIGIFMVGESPTGFPSDFLWHRGIVFFADPESQRPTPVSGFMTRDHGFVEAVLHKWWKILEKSCERKDQYWDARIYRDEPERWNVVIARVCELIMQPAAKQAAID